MSRNNFIPAAFAIGAGIFAGYYTFHPALLDYSNKDNRSSLNARESQVENQKNRLEETSQDPSAPVTVSEDPVGSPSTSWRRRFWPFTDSKAEAEAPGNSKK